MPDTPSTPKISPYRARLADRAKRGTLYALEATMGSVPIGVTLPCILVSLRLINRPSVEGVIFIEFNPFAIFVCAVIFCGPGAIVLSLILLKILVSKTTDWTLRQIICAGMFGGIAMAFCNLPGYLVIELLHGDTFVLERVTLLFAVAGASCGMWIAWQAWRASHPKERFLPRFSLRTLMLLVFLWGIVMLAFQPRQWTERHVSHHHGER